MNILLALTSHDTLGNTGRKTGFWLEEFAAPYYVFRADKSAIADSRPMPFTRSMEGAGTSITSAEAPSGQAAQPLRIEDTIVQLPACSFAANFAAAEPRRADRGLSSRRRPPSPRHGSAKRPRGSRGNRCSPAVLHRLLAAAYPRLFPAPFKLVPTPFRLVPAPSHRPHSRQSRSARCATAGTIGHDTSAASQLINRLRHLVVEAAEAHRSGGLPHADLISEGFLGLMRALCRFNPYGGVPFAIYARWWINEEISGFVVRSQPRTGEDARRSSHLQQNRCPRSVSGGQNERHPRISDTHSQPLFISPWPAGKKRLPS
jgi:hypothetical protein